MRKGLNFSFRKHSTKQPLAKMDVNSFEIKRKICCRYLHYAHNVSNSKLLWFLSDVMEPWVYSLRTLWTSYSCS